MNLRILLLFLLLCFSNALAEESVPSTMLKIQKDGRFATLNKTGWAVTSIDPYTAMFIEYASHINLPSLDIGSTYGYMSMPALEKGASVIANDLDVRHLMAYQERAKPKYRNHLSFLLGRFPNDTWLPNNSLGAVYSSRVFHFFDGPTLATSLQKIYDWLVPGGKFFLITNTPYLGTWEKFLPEYQKKRVRGDFFPGMMKNPAIYNPEKAKNLPDFLNFMDPDILIRLFSKTNFIIEQVGFIDCPDYPKELQGAKGRESVGIIVMKPLHS